MTRGPRRLKDDPDFKWETGCDIEDEARVVGGYDLDTSRSRLLAAVALLPAVTVGDGVPTVRPGASAWKAAIRPVVGAVTGAMIVAGSYWMGTRAGTDESDTPPEAPTEQRAAQAPARPARVIPAVGAPAGGAPVATAPGHVSRSETLGSRAILEDRTEPMPVSPTPAARPAPVPADDGTAEVEPSVPASAPAMASELDARIGGTAEAPAGEVVGPPALRESQFGLEKAFLDPADAALDAGRFGDARKVFETYLVRFPEGKMRVEAQWGLLEALQGSGDTAATATMAAQIQDLPSFSARREDILRLRAESLVRLDRCDDALLVAEELASRSAAEIRRACRQTRPE